jgi:hypothetical protein
LHGKRNVRALPRSKVTHRTIGDEILGRMATGGMGMTHSRKFVAILACCVAASAAFAGQAWGGKVFHESFRVEDGLFKFENFCDVEGMSVRETWVADVRVSAVRRGPNGFTYSSEHVREDGVFRNQANGKRVTRVITSNLKDLKVTDNGDGTLTILAKGTGNEVAYGADGKAIYRNPGQSRFEFLFDHGGTPTDPSDDEFISGERVKGSTGRTDDFCAAIVPALT